MNRLVKIEYPTFPDNDVQGCTSVAGAGCAGATNITYEYGPATLAGDANGNRAGRITKITSQAGTEERHYGRLGEVVKETKTLASATEGNSLNSPEVYTTLYHYDTFGRLQRLTYPNGEVLTYSYDAGRQLKYHGKNGYTYDYLKRGRHFEQWSFLETSNNAGACSSIDWGD